MNTIRIVAREFVRDVRAGVSDAWLLEKYGLSVAGLLKVKRQLVAKGLLNVDEVGPLETTGRLSADLVDLSDFVETFSKRPDDCHLMAKYSLTPDQLKEVYETAIRKGLLSEYEVNARARKAREIDDDARPGHDETSSETWKTEPVEVTGYSTEIRNFMLNFADDTGPYARSTDEPTRNVARQTGNRGSAAADPGSCPKCGHPKDPDLPDSCPHCGIVYAKLGTSALRGKVAVWDESFRPR